MIENRRNTANRRYYTIGCIRETRNSTKTSEAASRSYSKNKTKHSQVSSISAATPSKLFTTKQTWHTSRKLSIRAVINVNLMAHCCKLHHHIILLTFWKHSCYWVVTFKYGGYFIIRCLQAIFEVAEKGQIGIINLLIINIKITLRSLEVRYLKK